MAEINILSTDVCNRIAAGEVIERPYSVVKELVENAIDAGATEITVETEGGGRKLVRVTDNGKGILREDLKSAFLPHATSKLKEAEDLDHILTLGFRGEAVASIAAVSHMKITSKTAQGEAYSLECDGGVLGEVEEDAGANGTTVSVRDLFFNTPARLKFLKSDAAEDGDIANMVSRFILSRPNISFTLIVGGKVKYRSFGDGLRSALAVVYGSATLDECIEISADKHGISVKGFIGNQNYSKPNRSYQSLFVNGRYVVNQTVSSAVSNAYAAYLMKRQFPFYVLFLDVPPEIVDVNVHPNKADVRFADNQIIYGSVYHVLSSVLDGNARAIEYIVPASPVVGASEEGEKKPTVSLGGKPAAIGQPVFTREEGGAPVAGEAIPSAHADSRPSAPAVSRPAFAEKAPEKKPAAKSFDLGTIALPDRDMSYEEAKKELELSVPVTGGYKGSGKRNVLEVHSSEQEEKAEEKEDFFAENKRFLEEKERAQKQQKIDPASLTYKGELFHTYLIYEAGDAAYLIDQHAAHERLIYNRLRKKLDERKIIQQPMLTPYVLSVNVQEYSFLADNLSVFREMGFEIEEFGGTSFKISALPVDLQSIRLDEFFGEVLSNLETFRAIRLKDLLKDKLATSACKAAVKGGEYLSVEEATSLISMMEGDMSLKCPHGRPVAVQIKKTEIEKMFKRIVS